ncbi:MAG TPA: trigger factor [Acidimicrobiales bacterium]|jgi:trigger factor|nr:trigger factor [Acidimicrobiales bacterium]
METVVEPLEGNKIKLSVTIDEAEFEKALDATYRKIAREVRIPGFRPGKAPRRILEARLGKETARAEAIRGSLAEYYSEALKEHDVDAIAPPQIDITGGEHDGPVSFDAIIEVRPQVQIAGYAGLRVTIPSPLLTDEEVQVQLDRLRTNFGELVPVDRPAQDKDHVTLDLTVSRPGEGDGEDRTSTNEDLLYEVGSGSFGPQLDEHLRGAHVGDHLEFVVDLLSPTPETAEGEPSEAPGRQVSYDVTVKAVKEMILPEVTDEWASEASEFDTVDELMADIEKRLRVTKRAQANVALRTQAIDAIADLVQEDPPEALVNEEIGRRAQELESILRQQGLSVGQYLTATGRSQEQLIEELKVQSAQAVKADLALRALADAETIEVDDAEVDAEIARLADRFDATPEDVREQLESAEQMAAIRSDARKGKAIEWLVDHVEAVDPQGQPIDRALLAEPPEATAADAPTKATAADPAEASDAVDAEIAE